MKVGILNFQDTNWNYGAVLQAAALQHEIEKLGHTVQHIDVRMRLWKLPLFSKANVKKCILIILGKWQYHRSTGVFERFRKKWISRTKKFYNIKSLKNTKFDYDFVVVGSDQIWRWKFIGQKWFEVFFAGFFPENIKKVSYAASFGVDYWEKEKDDEYTLKTKNMLRKFSAISVREKSGVNICKEVFEVEAQDVIDPVLLAGRSFFDKIIESSAIEDAGGNDIVYYTFSDLTVQLNLIEKELSLNSQNIYFQTKKNKRKYPEVHDFLNKIKNSGFMLTDSFHGTCLAILFERPFVTFGFQKVGDDRLNTLLNICGLKECMISEDWDKNKLNEAVLFAKNINWIEVSEKLEKERKRSRDWLKNSLKEKIK